MSPPRLAPEPRPNRVGTPSDAGSLCSEAADGVSRGAPPGDVTVGLIGVGALGAGFARNLIRAGYRVRGFDLDRQRLDQLRSWGGHAAGSPAEAAIGARWVVTSLPDQADVRTVAFGPEGIVAGAPSAAILVDTTTSSPEASRALANDLATSGHGFVDASVSGTTATTMAGDSVLLVGGAAAEVSACQPLFAAIARRAYHLGPVGSGALAKLAVNVAVVGNRLALAEALSFGRAAGMDPAVLLEVLKDGPAYSRAMDLRGEKMVRRDYPPDSTLAASLHSAEVLLAEGHRIGAPLFLASLYTQLARVAASLGFADQDAAAVIEALEGMTRSGDGANEAP